MNIITAKEDLKKGKTIYDMPLRVAYYARVSTDKDDQLNSLENQQGYFEDMIKENENWVFVCGYIDEGISGTAVEHRDSFLQMVEDATFGKVDLIITKEISRFARNTVDSIRYTEYLLRNGVVVFFLNDNLITIQPDAELRLTIMSSLAQDEVRRLSERVKFGINRNIKEGKLIGGKLTGYDKKDGVFYINEHEAIMIRYIFNTYITGIVSLTQIGLELADMGYLNSKGQPYSSTSLAKFLTNARYKGFYTARLSEVEDYKTHRKKKVPKERQICYKDDRIPALVSEELWDGCNELYESRKKLRARHILNSDEVLKHSKYSCKIYCGDCNDIYTRNGGSNRSLKPTWSCNTYKRKGVSVCASPIIQESQLDNIFISVFSDFMAHKKEYLKQVLKEYENIIMKYTPTIDIDKAKNKIEQIEQQKDKLLDLNLKGIISDYELKKRNDKFNVELKQLESEINNLQNSDIEEKKLKNKIKAIENYLTTKLDIKENLPNLVKLLIDKVIVEKIDNSRKHIKLTIYFDFNTPVIDIDLDMNDKKKQNKRTPTTLACSNTSHVIRCSCIDTKQPGLCKNGTTPRKRNVI